ncbi:MAG: hypothetical protein Q8P33_01380 [bacterium]|nr:hypothetical protein [bacterium]
MATFLFIIASLIVLGVNIIGVVTHNPAIGFSTSVIFLAIGITGKLVDMTNIFLFWLSIGLAILYSGLGLLAIAL